MKRSVSKIILIISDTFRYDHLGFTRKKNVRTPYLDSFAKESITFENCYISSFPTIPHREDISTGKYSFPFHGWQPLHQDDIPIAEILLKNGFLTQLISDTPHLLKRGYNYDRGFIGYYWIRGQEGDIPLTRSNYPIQRMMPLEKTRQTRGYQDGTLLDLHRWVNWWWSSDEDTFVARTISTAMKWLEDNYKCDKFFLWVDCFDVHEPWDPPKYLVDLYDPDYDGPPMMHPNYGPADIYTKEELKNLWAHYAGEVTLVDKWVGKLIEKIKEVGIYDESLVIFTSDHGMYIGEHNRTGKSNLWEKDKRGPWPLYDEITHIPLIIHLPGAEVGRRCYEIVQPPDILPTILELVGIEKISNLHGISFVPLLMGEDKKWPRKYAFSSQELLQELPLPWTTVTSREWSFLIGGKLDDMPRLYHLPSDPHQTKNIFFENKELAKEMLNELLRFLKSIGTLDKKILALQQKFPD